MPIVVYHPTSKEAFVTINTPMEGFFDGANAVVEAMAFATTAAT